MGDWDFLHEMRDSGYSAEEIADAAACGLAPWHYQYIDSDWLDDELEKVPEEPWPLTLKYSAVQR